MVTKKWMEKNVEKIKKYKKEWSKKNRERVNENQRNYSKKTNYKYEKTEKAKFLRNIKRKTRRYFPLEGHNCEFCGKKAVEHHHNTRPIEFDKFNYVCKKCHKVQDKLIMGVKYNGNKCTKNNSYE